MYRLLIDGVVVPVLTTRGHSGYVGIHTASGPFGKVTLSHYQSEGFTLTYVDCAAIHSSTFEILHDMMLPKTYVVLLGSSSKFLIGGQALPLKEKQNGLLYTPHGNRAIQLPEGESCLYCIIQFPLSFLKEMIPQYLPLVPFFILTAMQKRYVGKPLYANKEMEEQLNEMLLIRQKDPLDFTTGLVPIIKPYLHEVFSHFCRSAHAGRDEIGTLADGVRQAAAIIRENPALPHDLDSLSYQVGISASSLRRGFPYIYNTTESKYLTERRLEAAVGMLLRTNWTEEIIAMRCGYYGNQSLIKAFKGQFGCTPGAIRAL